MWLLLVSILPYSALGDELRVCPAGECVGGVTRNIALLQVGAKVAHTAHKLDEEPEQPGEDEIAHKLDAEPEQPGEYVHDELEAEEFLPGDEGEGNQTQSPPPNQNQLAVLVQESANYTRGTSCHGLGWEECALLARHNHYRCLQWAPPMTWDHGLARRAQEWADRGEWRHSDTHWRNGAGENLAWGGPSQCVWTAMHHWWNEKEGLPEGGRTGEFSSAIGHYTQMAWRSSTRLGCGRSWMQMRGTWGQLTVCHYHSHGNVQGQFWSNVWGDSRSWNECGQ